MSDIAERKSLDAVLSQYALEPEIFDIFVEGELDTRVVEFALSKLSVVANVYPINAIDLPAKVIEREECTNNNRGRVLALSQIIGREYGDKKARVVCIIDRDCDLVLGQNVESDYIVYTDYTDMGMFVYQVEAIKKLAKLSCDIDESGVMMALASIESVGRFLFALRIVNYRLNWKMSKVALNRYITVASDCSGLNFLANEYVAAYLNSNGRVREAATFKAELEKAEGLLRGVQDIRNAANHHDLAALLSLFFKKCCNRVPHLGNADAVEAVLRTSADFAPIKSSRLFTHLKRSSG